MAKQVATRGRILAIDDDRRLLALRFEGGRTLDEVGEELGIGGNAAHGRIRRLLGRLRSAGHRPGGRTST